MDFRKTVSCLALAITLVGGSAGGSFAQTSTQAQTPPTPPPPPPTLGPRAGQNGQAAAPDQGPPVQTVATHGAWTVQCADAVPAQGDQPAVPKSCGMLQTGKSDKNPNIGLSLIINRIKQNDKPQIVMRALVPVGVYLPTGVAMEIDGTALEGRMTFTRCNPRACEGFGEASEASLKKFTKGKNAVFYIYDRPGSGFPIKFELAGFAEGLADLAKAQP